MTYQRTDLGERPLIIGDDNAHKYQAQVSDPRQPFSGGYRPRPYQQFGLGHYAPKYSGQIIPRRQWDELIELQDRNQSSPLHLHQQQNAPILDQNGYGYCWMFGAVAGVMNRYAAAGLPIPHLSATAPAWQGKRGKNQGGWAGEAVEYIAKFGIPTVDTWGEHDFSWGPADNHAQQLDARRHGIVEFEELPSQNFDAAVSCLLDPYNPTPVTLGLMWWGHLVCGLRAVKLGRGQYGIAIVNSWTAKWGENGYAVLKESKATAHEYVRIARVKPRAA